jgi:hypothetical protein
MPLFLTDKDKKINENYDRARRNREYQEESLRREQAYQKTVAERRVAAEKRDHEAKMKRMDAKAAIFLNEFPRHCKNCGSIYCSNGCGAKEWSR